MREAIFNIIGTGINGARFLDLYAGTGAVGFEALSRGAELTVFIETDPSRVNLIKKIGKEFGFLSHMKVYRMHAIDYLKKARDRGDTFDFIFVDPPYRSGELMKVLPFIAEGGLLKEDGVVIVEHPSKKLLPETIGILRQKKRYVYGDTALTTFVYA